MLDFIHTNEPSWQTITKKRKITKSLEGDKTGVMKNLAGKEKKFNTKLKLLIKNCFQMLERNDQAFNTTALMLTMTSDNINSTRDKKEPTLSIFL